MFVYENRVQSENINALYFSCRFSRLSVAFCELAWPCMAFLWSFIVFYGFLWFGWPFFGLLLQIIYLIGLVLFFVTVIDPNSFGLVEKGRDKNYVLEVLNINE